MYQDTHPRRLELFKWQHAHSSINEARLIIEYIRENNIDHEHPLHHALWSAFHVFYAKPFKQRQSIRIDESCIPDEYRNEHNAIITLRDKLFAHSDLNGLDLSPNNPINSLYVTYYPNTPQPIVFGVQYGFPAPEVIARYLELIQQLLQLTHTESARIFNVWTNNTILVPQRSYRVNTNPEPNDVLIAD